MATPPDVETLDRQFLAGQRERLRAELEATARRLEALAAEVNGLARRREAAGAEEGFGRVDVAGVELERARGEQAKATARLAELEAAMGRLDAGAYGRCEECGGPIGRARLEAIPEAARCITCQAHPRRRGRVRRPA